MKVTRTGIKTYEMEAETHVDYDLLSDLDLLGIKAVTLTRHPRERVELPRGTAWRTNRFTCVVDPLDNEHLRDQPARETLSSIRQLIRLFLGEAATHHASNPLGQVSTPRELEEKLASSLEKLNSMLDGLVSVVNERKLGIKEMQGTHGQSPGGGEAIFGQEAGTPPEGGSA